jgi:Na+-driven multidrug efflux pump
MEVEAPMNTAIVQSLLKFLIRRGLSMLGAAGATVSDEWIMTTISLILLIGNEALQFYKAYRADRKKADVVKAFERAKGEL